MNKTVLFASLAACALAAPASAQVLDLPRPSPGARVMQVIGLTEVTVDYSSPGVKNRAVWGAVVPYDKVWRTGANALTKITFNKDVTLGDKPVAAGTYAVFTIPTRTTWTLILSKDLNQAATGSEYKQESDVARVQVTPQAAPLRERLTFLFENTTDDASTLALEWEKVRIAVAIKAKTDEQALANIKNVTDNAWRPFANAARYMLDSKKDYAAGLALIDQSLQLHEDWYNDWIKAQLMAAKGDKKAAYALAEKSKALGDKSKGFFAEDEVKKALNDWKPKK